MHDSEQKNNKTAYIRMRVTEDRKQEIKDFCEKNDATISKLMEYAIDRVMSDTDYNANRNEE